MNEFARQLLRIRKDLGFKSAKPFYESLAQRRSLGFNYSYYLRIEKGETLPSHKIVNELATLFEKEEAENLVLAYSKVLFPQFEYLFSSDDYKEAHETRQTKSTASRTAHHQELTERQFINLVNNKESYYIFLLTTLAREPIPLDTIEFFFSKKAIGKALELLEEMNLVSRSEGSLMPATTDIRVPPAENDPMKRAFSKMADLDEDFGEMFELESLLNKMMIHRVSPRYMDIIRSQLDVLFALIRSSHEVDSRYNDKVMQFKVSINYGKIPG